MFLPALFPELFYVRKLGYSGGFRALIEGGGEHIHIFRFCPTNFF